MENGNSLDIKYNISKLYILMGKICLIREEH